MTVSTLGSFSHEDSVERQGLTSTMRWNAPTRFAIRLWCVFFVIVVLPRSSQFFTYFNVWPRIINSVGRWPITHIFGWPDRSWAPPMSGADYLPDFLAVAVLGSASLIIAVVWSLADRRDSYLPRLFTWVFTTQRYLLSALMLFYAWDKILPGPSGWGPTVEKVTLPVTQLTPMALLWAFMSVSRPYVVFTGVVEFVGGVLLLTRRTTCMGALITTGAMINLFLLTLTYDVNVKLLSGQMLLMAVVLLAPYAKRLTLALREQPTGSVSPPHLF